MKKLIMAIAATASLGMTFGAIQTASADEHDRRYVIIERYCADRDNDGDCDDWHTHHDKWVQTDYDNFYHVHRDHFRTWSTAHRTQEHWDADDNDGNVDVIFGYKN